jgi:hypothetical protein
MPWHQFVDAVLWPSIDQARQQVGDAIHFAGLCRMRHKQVSTNDAMQAQFSAPSSLPANRNYYSEHF